MRISEIGNWARCEAMALKAPPRVGRLGVAAWVGTLAHAYLAGDPDPDPPGRLAFDRITQTANQAIIQANAIASCARETLARYGWGVAHNERVVRTDQDTGHMDIVARHKQGGDWAIIDLKTGNDIGAAWLQVGGYIEAYNSPLVTLGGVLHVERKPIGKSVTGTLEVRGGDGLVQAWREYRNRINAIQYGAIATRSPGRHCGVCRVADCAVRSEVR